MVHPCQSGPDTERDFPAVIADPYNTSPYRNNVYVLVRDGAEIHPNAGDFSCAYGEVFERSTDGGKTWGSGVWLGPNGIDFLGPFGSDFSLSDNRGMAVAPDGTIFLAGIGFCHTVSGVVSNVLVLRSTDGGLSFQEICVDAPIGVVQVEVAAASATHIYVMIFGGGETGYDHLYSVVSHDGGSSWSALARVDDVTSPDIQHVTLAGGLDMWDLSLSQQNGRLDVAWFDYRNYGGNYTLADIYYSYSYDGLSWAPNIRATPQGPYYMCTQGSNACDNNGNDYMWVASSYGADSNKAYIAASLGKVFPCTGACAALYTRLVTITFPRDCSSQEAQFQGKGHLSSSDTGPGHTDGSSLDQCTDKGEPVLSEPPSRLPRQNDQRSLD
jgi:hypothetical protein